MNKSQKRDLWTYVIIALLMANLFVINNYITSKAITIIEAKNNTSVTSAFNIQSLKTGVKDKYTDMIVHTKKVLGIAEPVVTESNITAFNDANLSGINVKSLVKLKSHSNATVPSTSTPVAVISDKPAQLPQKNVKDKNVMQKQVTKGSSL